MTRTMGMTKREMRMTKQSMVVQLDQKNYQVGEMEENLLN